MLPTLSSRRSRLKQTGRNKPILAGKTLAMIFEKPSLRTRQSQFCSVAMTCNWAAAGLLLRDEEIGLGKREPVQDVARVLSGMCDGIMARTFGHDKVLNLAKWSTIPVINGLTDYSHPCQAMADMMTLQEHFGELKGRTLAYIGDGNNVARSLSVACGKFGMRFVLSCPPSGYEACRARMWIGSCRRCRRWISRSFPIRLRPFAKPMRSTPTCPWVSMGQEMEKAKRMKDFYGLSDRRSTAPERHFDMRSYYIVCRRIAAWRSATV